MKKRICHISTVHRGVEIRIIRKEVASMAAMALRAGNEIRSFGLLVIGSHDPNRFQAGMGTVVLEQLADMAGASLSRALPPKESA